MYVDAIQIDQRNTSERSDQVMQIADIYRHADRVRDSLNENGGDWRPHSIILLGEVESTIIDAFLKLTRQKQTTNEAFKILCDSHPGPNAFQFICIGCFPLRTVRSAQVLADAEQAKRRLSMDCRGGGRIDEDNAIEKSDAAWRLTLVLRRQDSC